MRVLFVATVQSHIAQFHLGAIALLKENGYTVDVAARDNLAEKNGLSLENVDKVYDIPFDRSPFSTKNIRAYQELKKIIRTGKYDIIHCNTPVGGILTRLGAIKLRNKGGTVIYTAHGFHFYKGAPKRNWILFYPIEKIMAIFTDKLITINEEDYLLASKKFACKVFRIHGMGMKTEKYDAVSDDEVKNFRNSQGWKNDFLILYTGELNANKNQETVIKAMKKVLISIPYARLLLAGNGPKETELLQLIKKLKLEDRITLLGYCNNLEWYVHACDLVVSASRREGLGINIIEAMYCKKPVIASINRGHRELVKNGLNGYLVEADNSEKFSEYIIEFAKNREKRSEYGKTGYKMSLVYTDVNVKEELKTIYGLRKG